MRIFKDLDMVEQLGSGVPRILEFYNKDCFKFSEHFLRMTFFIGGDNTTISGGQIGGQIEIENQNFEISQRQKHLLKLLADDGKINRIDLAKQLKMNESAVSKHLELLK